MALTSQRNTPDYQTPRRLIVPVEASTLIYLGSMVGVDANGYAVPAQSAVRILGRAEAVYNGIPGQDANNNSPVTSGAAGAISIEVVVGAFSWDINSSDISQANIGQSCYAVDDHTVSSSSNGGARPFAGRILGLDPQTGGVVVDHARDERGANLNLLSGVGSNGAGACTVTGAVVGQPVKAVFGAATGGGTPIVKVPGTDFEAVVSVAGQVQQLASANLSGDTFIFVLGDK